jgi:GntR family transcriptional repressor for pyruvate dehydrogenase complex
MIAPTPKYKFQPIQAERVPARIAGQLQRAILAGQLQPGNRLPSERELAEQFQASRTSIREATRMLEMSGLVTIRPGGNGGTYVTRPDFAQLSDTLRIMLQGNHFKSTELYQVRLLLEPAAAQLAAQHADEDDLALLRASLEGSKGLADYPAGTLPASRNFHYLLAKASKSNLLLMLISSLLDLAETAEKTRGPLRRSPPAIRQRAHELMVEAVARKDARAAAAAAREHLQELLADVIP